MIELRDLDARQEGRTVIGLALPFSEPAIGNYGPEVAAPGAIATPITVELRDGHAGRVVGTAEIVETSAGYEIHGTVADSDEYRGRGLSVGFKALKEKTVHGIRVLQQIALDHVAFVAAPAYAIAGVTETRATQTESNPMEAEATTEAEATPVVAEPSTELVELRAEVAELSRTLQAVRTAFVTTTEEPFGQRMVPEIRSAGEWMYNTYRVLSPEFTNAEKMVALERLGASETEVRAVAASDSGDSPMPAPLLGPLVDELKTGRPFVNALGSFPLTPVGDTVSRPYVSQGTVAAYRGATETDELNSQQYITTSASDSVHELGIVNALSFKAAMRSSPSAVDGLLRDQMAAIAQKTEQSVINGGGTAGTAGDLEGILATSGIGAETLATWSASAFWASWVAAYAKCLAATNAAPRFVGMHARRWAAVLGLVDGNDRPLFNISSEGQAINVPGGGGFGAGSDLGGVQSIGSIQGVPVVATSGIPTNLGTGTDEDAIIMVGAGSPGFEFYEEGVRSASFLNPATFVTDFGHLTMQALVAIPSRVAGVVVISGDGLD